MSYEPPTPPAELPTDIVDTLNDYSPEPFVTSPATQRNSLNTVSVKSVLPRKRKRMKSTNGRTISRRTFP